MREQQQPPTNHHHNTTHQRLLTTNKINVLDINVKPQNNTHTTHAHSQRVHSSAQRLVLHAAGHAPIPARCEWGSIFLRC
jgi:hypothetical protein